MIVIFKNDFKYEQQGGDKDKQMMPPPTGIPHSNNSNRKKKSRRANGGSPSIKESVSDSESDTACGFGTEWQSP